MILPNVTIESLIHRRRVGRRRWEGGDALVKW